MKIRRPFAEYLIKLFKDRPDDFMETIYSLVYRQLGTGFDATVIDDFGYMYDEARRGENDKVLSRLAFIYLTAEERSS